MHKKYYHSLEIVSDIDQIPDLCKVIFLIWIKYQIVAKFSSEMNQIPDYIAKFSSEMDQIPDPCKLVFWNGSNSEIWNGSNTVLIVAMLFFETK